MKNVIKNMWRWLRTTGGAFAALMLLGIGLLIWVALPSEVPESPVGPSEPVASTLVPASTTERVTERSERSDGIVGHDPIDTCVHECLDTVQCGSHARDEQACYLACESDPHERERSWGSWCNETEVGAADSCSTWPFCKLQHGYCKTHCSASGHVCDPSGCNITDLDFGALMAAIDEHGETAVRDLLEAEGFNFESCDCSKTSDFCKTLGWPFCCACHQHHLDHPDSCLPPPLCYAQHGYCKETCGCSEAEDCATDEASIRQRMLDGWCSEEEPANGG